MCLRVWQGRLLLAEESVGLGRCRWPGLQCRPPFLRCTSDATQAGLSATVVVQTHLCLLSPNRKQRRRREGLGTCRTVGSRLLPHAVLCCWLSNAIRAVSAEMGRRRTQVAGSLARCPRCGAGGEAWSRPALPALRLPSPTESTGAGGARRTAGGVLCLRLCTPSVHRGPQEARWELAPVSHIYYF